jgi:hypothetical protein
VYSGVPKTTPISHTLLDQVVRVTFFAAWVAGVPSVRMASMRN